MHHVIRELMPKISQKKSMYFLKVRISENRTFLFKNFYVNDYHITATQLIFYLANVVATQR